MDQSQKLQAGALMPKFSVAKAGGGEIKLGDPSGWQMVVVYRGKHCPICRKYLNGLEGLFDKFHEIGTEVVALSADSQDKAEGQVAAEGWRFPVGYGLTLEQMRSLGLYISKPRSPQETDQPFPEPGLFVLTPEGRLQVIDISNAPFARPDLEGVLGGLRYIQGSQYPIRGTA